MNDRRPLIQAGSVADSDKYPVISRRDFMARMMMLASLVSLYPANLLAEIRQANAREQKNDIDAEWMYPA